jgi:hypothetical protein
VLSTHLGTWQIAGNTCEAILLLDRPRSITISLEWGRGPGPTENEHLRLALPDIVGSALEVIERLAAISEAIQGLVAEGKLCRIGIRDGSFIYAATDPNTPDDTFINGDAPPTI